MYRRYEQTAKLVSPIVEQDAGFRAIVEQQTASERSVRTVCVDHRLNVTNALAPY